MFSVSLALQSLAVYLDQIDPSRNDNIQQDLRSLSDMLAKNPALDQLLLDYMPHLKDLQ